MDSDEKESGMTGSGLAGLGVSRKLSEGHCSVRWLVVEVRKRSTLASARWSHLTVDLIAAFSTGGKGVEVEKKEWRG